MGELLGYLAYAAGLAAVMYGLWQFARLARRRRIDSALMGIADDLFHPVAKEQQEEHRVAEERRVPSPSPGDGDPDGEDGIRL
jgi:hypothetical protein